MIKDVFELIKKLIRFFNPAYHPPKENLSDSFWKDLDETEGVNHDNYFSGQVKHSDVVLQLLERVKKSPEHDSFLRKDAIENIFFFFLKGAILLLLASIFVNDSGSNGSGSMTFVAIDGIFGLLDSIAYLFLAIGVGIIISSMYHNWKDVFSRNLSPRQKQKIIRIDPQKYLPSFLRDLEKKFEEMDLELRQIKDPI